jgi:hypothetical protein
MNATRNRLLNAAISKYMSNGDEQINQLVDRQFNRPNRLGGRQHRRINPKRQLRKLILRFGLV